jgi:Mn-dependent DtxR family transcriptional regulator
MVIELTPRLRRQSDTELAAGLLMAAQEGARLEMIAQRLGLSRATVSKYVKLTIRHGLLQSEAGYLRVSDKGRKFLEEFRKYRRLEREYLHKRKLVVEIFPGLIKSSFNRGMPN